MLLDGPLRTTALVIGIVFLASGSAGATENKMFKKPKINGNALDYCLTWSSKCGKPAADAFCKAQGFAEAGLHAKWSSAGKTELIGSGQMCNDPGCDSFNYIVCLPQKKGLNVGATTDTDLGEVNGQ